MARTIYPTRELPRVNIAFESTEFSFRHLEATLDAVLADVSKKMQVEVSEDDADKILEECLELLDSCQTLTDRLREAKSYVKILNDVCHSVVAQKNGPLKSLAFRTKASSAISRAASCKISSISASEVRRLQSFDDNGNVSADSLLRIVNTAAMVQLPDSRNEESNRHGLCGLFNRLFSGHGIKVRELEAANALVMELDSEMTTNGTLDDFTDGNVCCNELKSCVGALDQGICSLEKKSRKLYSELMECRIALLNRISYGSD